MRTGFLALLGSLLIAVTLGPAIRTALSATPPATATELHACPGAHGATHRTPTQPSAPRQGPSSRDYVIATRMGWAIS